MSYLVPPGLMSPSAASASEPALEFTSLLSPNAHPFYARLAEHLSAMGLPMTFHDGLGWPEALERLLRGETQAAFLCGLVLTQQSALLEPLVAPIPKARRYLGAPVYFADVVVRADSPHTTWKGLRGARWAYNEPNSFSGYLAVLAQLAKEDEDTTFFGSKSETGSHLDSLRWVLTGQAEVAAIDSVALEFELSSRPKLGQQLRIVRSLGPYPIPPLAVRRDLEGEAKRALRRALLELHREERGRALLETSPFLGFTSVGEGYYEPVREAARQARGLVSLERSVPAYA